MRRTISLGIAALMVAACSEHIEIPGLASGEGSVATVSTTPFMAGDGTRAELNPTGGSVAFSWQKEDKLAIYASEGTGLTNFDIRTIDAKDPAHAIFQANGFNLKDGSKYHAFFPYQADATDKTCVPVSYVGMVQASDNAYGHLGGFDYQYAEATAAGSTDAANIKFELQHLGAICRFKITGVPRGIKFSRLSLSHANIVTEGTIDLTNNALTAAYNNKTTQNILLGEGDGTGYASSNDSTLTFYAMMAPANLSEGTFTLRLYSDKSDMSIYETTLTGKDMTGGKAYGYTRAYSSEPAEPETDEWVDLGLEREDGTRILFGKNNLGYTQGNLPGQEFAWTVSDPVPARRGANWRTPSLSELKALFNKKAADYALTWEQADGGKGVWVINTAMEQAEGKEGTHRIFLPFANDQQKGLYWSATANNSCWPAAATSIDEEPVGDDAPDDNSPEGPREYALYYSTQLTTNGEILNASSRLPVGTQIKIMIRPIYVGE